MLDYNNIYCGKCEDFIPKIVTESIDLVITSPPYFNAREYSQYENVKEYMKTMSVVFGGIERILKKSRMCIVNISPVIVPRENRSKQSYRIPLPFYFVPMMEEIGYEFLEDIIWVKPEGAAVNRNGGFFRSRKPIAYKPNVITEYLLVFKKKANFLIDKVIKKQSLVEGDYEKTNVWRINPETKTDHPAPFPERLVENCVRYYSYENDIVLDPFGGSGTVGSVCKKLNRNFILIEKEEKYCEMARRRILSITPPTRGGACST